MCLLHRLLNWLNICKDGIKELNRFQMFVNYNDMCFFKCMHIQCPYLRPNTLLILFKFGLFSNLGYILFDFDKHTNRQAGGN